jgi:hypothetical protein
VNDRQPQSNKTHNDHQGQRGLDPPQLAPRAERPVLEETNTLNRGSTMHFSIRPAALAVALTAALGLPALAAGAPRSTIVFVSHTGVTGARDVDCATAAYQSVQDAVNAASDDAAVYLCGHHPFTGPVVITKNLELTGDRGATISSNDNPAQPTADQIPEQYFGGPYSGLEPPDAVVAVLADVHVRIDGLRIRGRFVNASCPSHADDFGIIALGSPGNGATLQLRHDTVTDIGSSNQPSCGGLGIGLLLGRYSFPTANGVRIVNFTAHAHIRNTIIDGYQSGALFVDGASSTVDLHGSIVRGSGPNSTLEQVGVQISRGATGELTDNLIAGHEYNGTNPGLVGIGIDIFGGCTDVGGGPLDTNVHVAGNHIANNDLGVVVLQGDNRCVNPAPTPTAEQIVANLITKDDGLTNGATEIDQYGNAYAGYQAGIEDSGNSDTITHNTIASSGSAFGPQVVPPGPFLAPIDIQNYPTSNPIIHANIYNGRPTTPPYPGEPGAPTPSSLTPLVPALPIHTPTAARPSITSRLS